MGAPDLVLELVERFARNRAQYLNPAYNETQVRREFLDPFFRELGWDVDNTAGNAPQYREVVHEDAIKIGLDTRAPDYSFRIGGQRKFFVEAKKPAVNLKDDPAPAYQLRRYSWSAKLPLSVLTDFQEFAVYDGRVKPAASDKPSAARTLYIPCEQYEERWDEIASVFSKEAILQGSFDRYAESTKAKKGTAEVDKAFLGEIEGWRDALARNIALRNSALSQRELNYAVQATIDRIIFLRICEDRGIEPYGRLQGLCNGGGTYGRLKALFYEADQRYNSGLFHFEEEKGRPGIADRLTLDLTIDDKPLKDILRRLYYPDSPYEFSVLPADILGQVYEQFLGKVIRLTAGHRAVVEDKPEVKKAGGVYYTPTYIVDYIVKHTVGRLLEGKTPKQAASLRILDPACGSGSFLIGAFQHLLDWHRDSYVADEQGNAKKHAKALYQGRGGEWRLTTAEKKRILQSCIYGVDIDAQAVETTKLSLLLKVLEGETAESIDAQLSFLRERALPDLSANIKCGNSLIGPDFYDDQQLGLAGLDEEERYRINVFDWEAEFPEILGKAVPEERRGFDAVIGNPPYGFHQIHSAAVKPYFKRTLVSSAGSFEHYFLFYEASLRLLAPGGWHGFIVPVTWLTIPSAQALRRYILDGFALKEVAWLPELVFSGAQVNTLVSTIRRSVPDQTSILISEVNDPAKGDGVRRTVPQQQFADCGHIIHIFQDAAETDLLAKVEATSVPLASIATPCSGYNPYEVGKGTAPDGGSHSKSTVALKPYHASTQLGPEWKPEIVGRDLTRYGIKSTNHRFVKYGPWLAAPRDPGNFVGPRILIQEITGGPTRRIVAAYREEELYHSRDIIPVRLAPGSDAMVLLAVANSRLISWWHHLTSPKAKKALFPKVLVGDVRRMPVAAAALVERTAGDRVDRLHVLAQRMCELAAQTPAVPEAQASRDREIAATDGSIDRLVYELYGLSDHEIALVEESLPPA